MGRLGVEVHRHRVDVDEHRLRARQRDDVAGGRERVGGDEHLVAGPDPEREHGHVERGRAGRDDDGVVGAAGLGEQPLELGHLRAHGELAGLDDRGELRELLLADVGRGEPDYVSAGFRARYHAMVRARPSSRSTCASKPSCSRAFDTLGMRISTSV